MQSSYAYLLAPVGGFVVAQLIKYVLRPASQRTWKSLFYSGSMPSGHSAVVASISTVIFVHEGFSTLFAVVATLAMLTIYDALVARRSIGEQGQALVRLIETSPFANDPRPRIALGHKPKEVVAGTGIGIVVGCIVAFFIT